MSTHQMGSSVPPEALSVEKAARSHPDEVALVFPERSYTYRQLAERVGPVAEKVALLRRQHQSPTIALSGTPQLEHLLILYACLQVSQPVLLVHPQWTQDTKNRLIELTSAFTISGSDDPIELSMPPEKTSGSKQERQNGGQVLIGTSGSTATPKLVELSAKALLAAAQASESNLPLQMNDRWLLSLPIAHVGGLSIIVRSLVARRAVVVAQLRPDQADFSEQLERHQVTLLSLVPTQLQQLLSNERPLAKTIRAVLLGGAASTPRLRITARQKGIPLLCTYGMTEMASQVATQSLSDHLEALHCPDQEEPPQLLRGIEAKITGDGVLALRGPQMMSCYYGEVDSPTDREGWFVTSDRAELTADRRVIIHGRRDNTIISGGENVQAESVENAMHTLAHLCSVCVVGVPDEYWGQRIVAVFTAKFEDCTHDEQLKKWQNTLGMMLPDFARPKDYLQTDELTLLANGKLNRSAIRRWAQEELKRRVSR